MNLVPVRAGRNWNPVPANLGNAADVARSLTQSVRSAARGSVRTVTLRSNLSPDVVLTGADIWGPGTLVDPRTGKPVGPGQGGVVSRGRAFQLREAFLRFAKPEVEIDTLGGVIRVAPYGQPSMNLFWPLVIVGGAGLAAVTLLAVRGLTSKG